MDANTTKTFSLTFVVLLLASAFAAVVPTAVAQASSATVDAELGAADPENNVTAGGPLRYNEVRTINVINITRGGTADVGSVWGLVPPGFATAIDNRTATNYNATHIQVSFPNVLLDAVGVWSVEGPGGEDIEFEVLPQANLQVTLSQNSFTYTENQTQFLVTVVDLQTGAAAANVPLDFNIPTPPLNPKTNANGQYTFLGFIGGVGSYTVNATKNVTGDSLPELSGSATFTVGPAALDVTTGSTVKAGFDDTATFNITYPLNDTGVLSAADFIRYNLTVTLQNGSRLYVNDTDITPGTVLLMNGTEGGVTYTAATWTYNSRGNFTFAPAATWAAGTYTFELRVNTRVNPSNDASDALQNAEYLGTWSISTTTPSDINIRVQNELGGAQLQNFTVQPTAGLPTAPVAGHYNVTVKIEGNQLGQFPGDATIDSGVAFPTSNITLTGDVLPGWSVSGYNAANGTATIINVVPTKYGGNVAINVAWKNTTTTTSLPIVQGAIGSTDVSEIRVDQTSTVTVTLTDQYGNPVPDGTVYVYDGVQNGLYAGIAQYSVHGTGAPGVGQNGQYTLTVKPTAVGNMTVYGVIGTAGNNNYTYVNVRVVPAHDLNVTISANSTMAGLKTYVFVNATQVDGVSTPASSTAVYFLNETNVADLEANASLPSGARGFVFDGSPASTGLTNNLGIVDGSLATVSGAGFNLNVSLPAGTYSVYVCSNFTGSSCNTAKHDNLNNTPTFTVSPYSATFSPNEVANNPDIQQDQVVNVTVVDADGNPAYGTLKLAPSANVSLYGAGTSTNITTNVSIVNGTGQFIITGVATGTLAFEFDPWGDSYTAFAAVPETFGIVGPAVTVDPANIPVGTTSSITVTVKSLNGSALADRVVRICGQPIGGSATAPTTITANTTGCTGERTTDSNGVARFAVLPNADGTLYLYVNNTRTTTTIAVVAGLVLSISPSSPSVGDSVTITVNQPGQTGESGVAITVMRGNETVLNQTTGSAGQVVLPNVEAGNYTITATKGGFEAATLNFTVEEGEAPTTGAEFSLENLDVPSTGSVGAGITVSADVVNSGDEAGTATVLLIVDGAVRDSQNVPVSADGRETVAFDFTPNTAKAYRVTVRLAGGETLAEKTVTVETPTTPTGPTGPTEPTGPTGPTGPTEPTEPTGVPGFELVALVGALAAALLVFRRRN